MDPFTQGTIGAILPQSVSKKSHFRYATILGLLGGMAPDLDTFIRSNSDPLLFLEYHRNFTHALLFIPVGGLISTAVLFSLYFKKKLSFKWTYIYTTLGYATHALLDACTTYGTQLLWPFSNMRVAWNNISIIDPLFTIPLICFVVLSFKKKNSIFAKMGLLFALFYLSLGVAQKNRAESFAKESLVSMGENPVNLVAKPSFGNLLLWKVIHENETQYFVNAVRVGLSNKFFKGRSIDKLDLKRDFPDINEGTVLAKDISRFNWFSNNYLAKDPFNENSIVDVRYSSLPHEIEPLWGIQFDPSNQQKHVKYVTFRRNAKEKLGTLWSMLWD